LPSKPAINSPTQWTQATCHTLAAGRRQDSYSPTSIIQALPSFTGPMISVEIRSERRMRSITDIRAASIRSSTIRSMTSTPGLPTKASCKALRLGSGRRISRRATKTTPTPKRVTMPFRRDRRNSRGYLVTHLRRVGRRSVRRMHRALQGAGFGNQARAQGLTEGAALRQQPLNELNALRSQSQVSQPQFGQVYHTDANPTDVAGNIYKSNQIDSANSNAFMNGLFGIASAGASAIKFSDRSLKRDIRRIGETARDKLALYAYRYLWSDKWSVGVMADEARKVRPAAVIRNGRYDMVDYGLIG
jgi:hypothetical protein